MSAIHPELRGIRFVPVLSYGPLLTRIMKRANARPLPAPDDVSIEDVVDGDVSLRIFRPVGATGATPALLWMHGGGYIIGAPEQDDRTNILFARELGITVAAVRYRLAPEHPAPAAVDDAYAALLWLAENAAERGIDPSRIAVGGASAGGGLAAALTLLAHDRGGVVPVFQLLLYPMLDDRTATRTDLDTRNVRVWLPKSNRYGWSSYLGVPPGSDGVSPYAAPARRDDLTGLPPAWIGVGTLDLFYDEDLAFAKRLREAGVATELYEVKGAFHGFDAVFSKSQVAGDFWREQARALRATLL
ncbi:alpha/beta hydrolase [soil metagenome]